jgi:hypothetical protein
MIYFLSAILILILAAALLRVRLRLEISTERRILFVGLGRSGPEIDFVKREGVLKLFGLRLKRFSLDHSRPAEGTTQPASAESSETTRTPSKPSTRRRSIKSILEIVPQCTSAFWKYGLGLLRNTIVVEAEAEIEAGFDTPDITGQAFGYYQAALAAAPGLFTRVSFIPNWTGRTFSGSARLSLAWPMYRLLWQTTLLFWRLPKRKIYRLAIGDKKGVRDVEQQRG